MKTPALIAFAFTALLVTGSLHAQVPQLLNHQGRVAVDGVNFPGPTGQFKFGLVNATGTVRFWTNSTDIAPMDGVPDNAVTLPVTNGLYSVLLGDTAITNMLAIPANVWSNADVRLRVWFNDGTHGFQLLTPDQRIAPNGYLSDGAVSAATIATGAVTSTKIALGAVGSTQLAANAVLGSNIASDAIGSAQIAPAAVGSSELDPSTVGLWSVSGANIFRNSGTVGIGTSSPLAGLDVRGLANFGRILAGNPNADTWVELWSGNGDGANDPAIIWSDGTVGDDLRFLTGDPDGSPSVEWMRIRGTDGSVGIGTMNPQAKLEVVGGAIKATGGLIIENRTSDPPAAVAGQIWLRTDL